MTLQGGASGGGASGGGASGSGASGGGASGDGGHGGGREGDCGDLSGIAVCQVYDSSRYTSGIRLGTRSPYARVSVSSIDTG